MGIDGEDEYREAGKLASQVRKEIPRIVKPNRPILEVCEEVENLIRHLGGSPAFPCNVCVNEVAAHYTSRLGGEMKIPEESLVKVDLGVCIDGYIADTALSIAFDNTFVPLISASMKALETAIDALKPGIALGEVGSRVEEVIMNYGFKPIRNLTGHKLGRYVLHAGKSVPNVTTGSGLKVLEGEVYAVEPFVTTQAGAGRVVDSPETYIYRYAKEKGVKDEGDKALIKMVKKDFNGLPFALRWIKDSEKDPGFMSRFERLLSKGCFFSYPVLMEEFSRPVAQSEHTVLVEEERCVVLTA